MDNTGVRGELQSKLYTSQQWRRQGGNVPPKPGKFAKDGKQFAPQPAVSLESNKKLKIFVNFLKLLLKFFLKLSNFS